jgi:hypothetical protein
MGFFDPVSKLFRPKPLNEQPTPASWQQTLYGPGTPIRPTSKPWEEDFPRAIDYPPNVNATISPRTSYGLMPFNALALAWETLDELKHIVHMLCKEFLIFTPSLHDSKGNDVSQDPAWEWFLRSPDRDLGFDVWATRFIQNAVVFDSGCLGWNMDDKALEYIDGTTIFTLIDAHGHTPKPPEPAFVQIIHGMPFNWFDRSKIWYRPRWPRYNAPYGMSPIEEAWTACLILANINGFELAHYREGNMPEGILGQDGEEQLTPAQVEQWEQLFNSTMRAGSLEERSRIKVVPFKPFFIPTKKPDFPQQLYDVCYHRLGLACGVPPSELGDTPGKGLGGKGFMDMATQTFYRIGLGPLQMYLQRACREFIRAVGGGNDVIFELQLPTQGLDPASMQTAAVTQFAGGLITLNEARAAVGQEKLPGGDILCVIRNNGITNISDWLTKGAKSTDPASQVATGDSSSTGSSTTDGSISPAAYDGQSTPSSQDTKLAARIIGEGTLSPGKTTSAPRSRSKPSSASKSLGRHELAVKKICGVDEGDDDYYGAPLAAPNATLEVPFGGHANGVYIVALVPEGKEPRTGIWKPYADENPKLIERVGHPQYLGDAAAYILDRTLGLYCCPVAYVAKVEDQPGVVSMYVTHRQPAQPPSEYSPYWVERAAVLDYLGGNLDRRMGDGIKGNWLTHPSDERRPVLIDQGLFFPVENKPIMSPFVDAVANQPFSPDMDWTLKHATKWDDMWSDLAALVGDEAVKLCQERLVAAIEAGGIPIVAAATWTSGSDSTTTTETPVGDGTPQKPGGES